jgi:bifunctional non-homologous end joining protein LigD
MDLMKPIARNDIPIGDEWLYEVKFDGFRCVLHWEQDNIRLKSGNNKDLTANFPEIVAYCYQKQALVTPYLPLKLDGELVVLNNNFQANFSWIQKRGRLRSNESIDMAMEIRPANLMVFDLLQFKGEDLVHKSYQDRKQSMIDLFAKAALDRRIEMVNTFEYPDSLWQLITNYMGEGLIAKRKSSIYHKGKQHHDWFKVKNWRTIQVFLTHMNRENDYFTVGVYEQGTIKTVGKCKHGLDRETMHLLKQFFLTRGQKQGNTYSLPPAICAAIHTLDLLKEELREPVFKNLLPAVSPNECTMEQLQLDMAMIPSHIERTNTAKVFWPDKGLTKGDLLTYIRKVSPYMLPFLNEKALTTIRAPDGVDGESFFQKRLPAYAPAFIDTVVVDDEKLMVCNTLEALVWFANHGAIEYHVPFQLVGSEYPNEIVFDLDPPARERFDLAIQAAQVIKPMLDTIDLISFVKTSGNKGLQIHIPIPAGSMTYQETARFTQAIALTVENAYPNLYTTERLKKNRKGRLYIDYVQHGKDKTLIAPYSPRKTMDATVATPLYWHEVALGLLPEQFTIGNIIERIQHLGCPFSGYFDAGRSQHLDKIVQMVKD